MAMTSREALAKQELTKFLQQQGYATYAKLLNMFHLNLTQDPRVLGYMEPEKGRIVLNSSVDIDRVALIARHEILHFYLKHHERTLKKMAEMKGLDPNKLDDMSVKEIEEAVYGDPDRLDNWATDFDISNQGYTDKDKAIVRSLHGLVTEDFHEDWVDLTMEEMYEKLLDERKNKEKLVYGVFIDPSKFVGRDGRVYG